MPTKFKQLKDLQHVKKFYKRKEYKKNNGNIEKLVLGELEKSWIRELCERLNGSFNEQRNELTIGKDRYYVQKVTHRKKSKYTENKDGTPSDILETWLLGMSLTEAKYTIRLDRILCRQRQFDKFFNILQEINSP